MEEWNESPPVDWLVAGYLGYKSEKKKFDEAVENTRMMFESLKGGKVQGIGG